MIVTLPASIRSVNRPVTAAVSEVFQYSVPDPKLVVVTVNVTESPSSTDGVVVAIAYRVAAVELSLTVTVVLYAKTSLLSGADNRLMKKFSVPSAAKSELRVRVNVAVLLRIVTDPVNVVSVKSAAIIVI